MKNNYAKENSTYFEICDYIVLIEIIDCSRMNQSKIIPLDEKFRILFRLFNDIIERKNLLDLTTIDLSDNQFIILKILSVTGPRSVSNLADALNISTAAASKNIDHLVKKKLISRKVVSTNRRKVDVSILLKGRNIVDGYNLNCEDKINSVLSHYSNSDQELFNSMIDKFIFYCIVEEDNLSLFCLQCGGKYEGQCPIGNIEHGCYFLLSDKNNVN